MNASRVIVVSSLLLAGTYIFSGLCRPTYTLATDQEIANQVIVPDTGSKEEAEAYYSRLKQTLGIDDHLALNGVLKYYGYAGLTANTIETQSSIDLMNSPLFGSGDILATVYFAPKVSDVAFADKYASIGWRKLVRLKARAGSDAINKNLTAIYLLFNFFSKGSTEANKDPFSGRSSNIQAILVHSNGTADYMDFSGHDSLYARSLQLNASFDASNPNQPNQGLKNSYYVPEACNMCHGCASNNQPELNFIDTDYLFDRVQPGNDFEDLRAGKYGVLTDGGKIQSDGGTEETTIPYTKAFNIIKSLNTEAMIQNATVDTSDKNLQYILSKNWLNRHVESSTYLHPVDRGLSSDSPWSSTNANDAALLDDLDRYCYRCHGTIRYSVYDRPFVKGKALYMESLLKSHSMPKDRTLNAETITKISNELDKLHNE